MKLYDAGSTMIILVIVALAISIAHNVKKDDLQEAKEIIKIVKELEQEEINTEEKK